MPASLYKVRARSVVMAGGCWTTKRIVHDLPTSHRETYAQFYREFEIQFADPGVEAFAFTFG